MTSEVLRKCGKNIKLAINMVIAGQFSVNSPPDILTESHLSQQSMAGERLLFGQYLLDYLQPELAECRCSPFGRLRILSQVVSGSMAE